MTLPTQKDRFGKLTHRVLVGSIIACAGWFSPQASAQWYAAKFGNNTSGIQGADIGASETSVRTLSLSGSGLFNEADWVDDTLADVGAFNVNNLIPGNTPGDDNFYAIYASGVLHVTQTGDYRFKTRTDDSSRIVIDGRNVVVQQGCCAEVQGVNLIHLEAGSTHFISVVFREGGGGSGGDFFVAREGVGTNGLLGAATGNQVSPDMFVDQAFPAPAGNVGAVPGLLGSYYQLAGANQNLLVDQFLNTVPAPTPAATFTSSTINYNSAATTIEGHLGNDGPTLTGGNANSTDFSLFKFDGFLQILPADDIDTSIAGIQVKFAYDADDNARLTIGGLVVIENDGGHGINHFVTANEDLLSAGTGDNAGGSTILNFPTSGLYSLNAFYHNGNGGIAGLLTSTIGLLGGNVQAIPTTRFFQTVLPPGVPKFWSAGAGANLWETGGTIAWRLTNDAGPSTVPFGIDDAANFGDLGTQGARTITVGASGVIPNSINVNNAAANEYTIGGGGVISGPGGVTKTGNGALTMLGSNTFTGATTILHGTVNAASIGDTATVGNLGQGVEIVLGDTTGANDAKLNYTGANASLARALTVNGNGGELVVPTGTTLTLRNPFSGSGAFLKSGPGILNLASGAGTGFTGSLAVTGGNLTVVRLGIGTGALALSGGGTVNYAGATLNDTRNLSVGTGGITLKVNNVATRYRVDSANTTAGALTVDGPGRFAVNGVANFPTMPNINANATLALTNEAGTNTIPTAITVSTGTLELAPGSYAPTTAITLSGGTLRFGHEGLLGKYYSGGAAQADFAVTESILGSYFNALTPTVIARTNTAGRTDLSFNNGASNANAPFADQGFTEADNIRANYVGKILITTAGLTTFFTSSDDGTVLFIDGVRVVDNNFFQGITERQGTATLTAGLHDIRVGFYEGGGDAGLIISYTPVGGAKQVINNALVYAGDTIDAPDTNISVTTTSNLEIGHDAINLGNLNMTAGTTLNVTGSPKFKGTAVAAAATQTFNVANRLGVLNLGPITGGAGATFNKTGNGALLFNSVAPAALTINAMAGLVVIQALNDGVAPQNDPLAGSTINYTGGGLGFSAATGTVAPLTYTNNVVAPGNYRIEAGAFGSAAVAPITINWNPANSAVAVAAASVATFNVRDSGYTLNVGAPVSGAGGLAFEGGAVNFQSPVGINVAGGLSVQAATVTSAGPITAGPVTLTGVLDGVATLNPSLTAQGTLVVPSITVTRGALNVGGVTTNAGAFTQTGGSTNFAASSHASVAINGGTVTANGNLTSTGPVTVTNGTLTLNGAANNVSKLTVSGTGAATMIGNLASGTDGVSIVNGRTLSVNPGTGVTSTYTGGTVSLDNLGTLSAVTGIADFSAAAINVVTPLALVRTENALRAVQTATNVGTRALNADGAVQTLAAAPVLTTMLPNASGAANNGGIDFPNGTSDPIFTAFFGATVPDAFTAYFTGAFKAKVAGNHNFRYTDNDDFVIVIADTNFNGILDGADTMVSQGCCGGNNGLDVNLAVGQEISVGWFIDDSGGGSGLRGYFTEPAGGTFTTQTIVRPGDAGQAGYWSNTFGNGGGGNLAVGISGTGGAAELRVKSFTGVTNITLSGGFQDADAAILRVGNNAAPTVNTAQLLKVDGFFARGSLVLGDNNAVTLGLISVPDDGALNIDKTADATSGGVVTVTGQVQGVVGTAPSAAGTGMIVVKGGTLLVNAPITGTGTITPTGTVSVSASIAGTIGGNSSIEGPVKIDSGGRLAPGGVIAGQQIGVLTTGPLSLGTGAALRIELTDTITYDSLTVNGAVSLGNSNLELRLLNFTGGLNSVYYIVNNLGVDPVQGTFLGLADQATFLAPDGFSQFQISYDAVFGGNFLQGGNDIALQLVAVPEPGSLVALLSGVGMLLGMQRLRRRSS